MDLFTTELDQWTLRIRAAQIVARKIIAARKTKPMSALSKAKALGERSQQFDKALGDDLDKEMAGYDELDKRKAAALAKHQNYRKRAIEDLKSAEQAIDVLSNMAPEGEKTPLDGSPIGSGNPQNMQAAAADPVQFQQGQAAINTNAGNLALPKADVLASDEALKKTQSA